MTTKTPDKPYKIREATREEERLTEDEIARRKLGPRGVPGAPDTATMTPHSGVGDAVIAKPPDC